MNLEVVYALLIRGISILEEAKEDEDQDPVADDFTDGDPKDETVTTDTGHAGANSQ